MPKLVANLSTLFTEVEFLERFAAARAAGFRYVEYQFPYAWPAPEIARAINFAFLLAHLDRLGYSGWVGCEYNPRSDTVAGLTWAKPYLSP